MLSCLCHDFNNHLTFQIRCLVQKGSFSTIKTTFIYIKIIDTECKNLLKNKVSIYALDMLAEVVKGFRK